MQWLARPLTIIRFLISPVGKEGFFVSTECPKVRNGVDIQEYAPLVSQNRLVGLI